jgi:hypothetical protein
MVACGRHAVIEVINHLLTRTTPDGVAAAIGNVIAVDDETALVEASNDVRSRCARDELSQDDVILVEDPDGRQVEEATVEEFFKRR